MQRTSLHGDVETYPAESAVPHLGNVADAYVHAQDTGTPLHETLALEMNIQAMAILDAGIRSAQSGQQENVWAPDRAVDGE